MEAQSSMSGLGQISNVVSLNSNAIAVNGGGLTSLTAVPGNAVSMPVSGTVQAVQGLPQLAWYNYSADNVGQLISGPAVQLELAGNSDIAKQFNQQVQTQYGPIQVQLVQAPAGHQQQVIPIQISHQQLQQQTIQQQQNQPLQHTQIVQLQDGQQIQIQHQPQQSQLIPQALPDHNFKVEEVYVTDTSSAKNNASDAPKKSRVKSNTGERVPCPMCKKTVSCTATLRDHMRTHTGERPFRCSECDLAFSQRSNLRMHKRLHTGERPYMCGICGKTFARSSHLPAHMRTHTGEKPYSCEVCGHAFITAQQLKNHNRVHTGEKPWKCDLCDAAFTHSSSLSTHKKKHTGNKPFQCDKCSKKFFFTSALDKHLKVHTKVRPFKCLSCENTFKYKESLTVHIERYCGKQTEKKVRAPRKADAKKPGPKPGTGRKYVQQKKGRPRGRPRKKGRWGKRGKKSPTKAEAKQEAQQQSTSDDVPSSVLGIADSFVIEKVTDMIYSPPDDEDDENIPVAELKIESIEGSNETRVLMESLPSDSEMDAQSGSGGTIINMQEGSQIASRGGVMLSGDDSIRASVGGNAVTMVGSTDEGVASEVAHHHNLQQSQNHHTEASHSISAASIAAGSIVTVAGTNGAGDLGSNMMQLDPHTSLTIVTAEEAERHMAAGGLQLLTLQPDMLMSHAQLITPEQLQQLQQHHLQQQHPVTTSAGNNVSQSMSGSVAHHQQQHIQHIQVQQQTIQLQQTQSHERQHEQHQDPQQHIQIGHQQVDQQQPITFSEPPSSLTHELVIKDGIQVYYPRQFT